ncbi:MAG: PBP1A family penicillin-binding protein [Acidobacteria bacterium]|nr:PBP1A family penicillin-binding protein [Acidobacteriota bacterium]
MRMPSRGTVFRTIAWSVVILAIVMVVSAGLLYYQATKRFEIRRVSLPTLIYTDATPLRPGVETTADQLEARLQRLGYRAVEEPSKEGEYNREGTTFAIWGRSFDYPDGDREGGLYTVNLAGGAIESVTNGPEGAPVETAILEPELLTSILSDRLENRSPVTLEQIPEHLQDAVIVAEDVRFRRHAGVDPLGIFRALFANLRSGGVREGGSTLTQQLVKNYYLTGEQSYRRKILEAFMAVILEARYSKNEILSAYLNDIYLGRDQSISIIGVGQASRFYFGKPVSEIGISESALLASMIPSPNNYSPFEAPDTAKKRRDRVLKRMLDAGEITEEEYEEAVETALPEAPDRTRRNLGSIPFFVDAVIRELQENYGIDDPAGQGLSVYTTIDLGWQEAAATRLKTGLERLARTVPEIRSRPEPVQGALIAVDVPSGEIRALVGGRDFEISQFNRALSAERQVGSLFKPFILLAAFEPSLSKQNITPATQVKDEPFTYKRRFARDWSPKNYEGAYYGVVTVRQMLEKSMNTASVRLGLATGLDAVIRAAKAVGIEAELDEVPALFLGSADIPPIQMAEAYTTIARMGSRIPLHTVRYIVDEDGDVVKGEVDSLQVFPERDAYLVVDVMKGVVDRGTAAGVRASGFRAPAAGKTGTTNDRRDSWFIGFTPDILALTWVGFDDNAPIGVSGSEGALPIWTSFIRDVADGNRDFAVPPGITFVTIDRTTGQLASPYCPENVQISEAFKSGTQPALTCQKHLRPEPELPDLEFPSFEDLMGEGIEGTGDVLEGGIFRTEPGEEQQQTPSQPRPIEEPPRMERRQPLPVDTSGSRREVERQREPPPRDQPQDEPPDEPPDDEEDPPSSESSRPNESMSLVR